MDPLTAQRRLAQYHPTIWSSKLIDSFITPYSYESHATHLEGLKQKVSQHAKALVESSNACSILKLIDSMQRLGVAYHFEKEIQEALATLVSSTNTRSTTNDLHTVALHFRILRQHGIPISSDFLNEFRSDDGGFKDSLSTDLEGLLSLYEAAHLGMPGEDVLEEAKSFSMNYLKQSMGTIVNDDNLLKRIKQSLETAVHFRMPRLEVLSFMDIYLRDDSRNTDLLELARLDYNLVQSLYQTEIKELSRWWRELDFKSKASFSRDRLMENYLWVIGTVYEPQLSESRIDLTKFVCILSAIDDMYDVHGFLHELEQFTKTVTQWTLEAKEDLPEYMRPIYTAMIEFGTESSHKNNGVNTLPYIRKEWVNLCQSYMVEARWFYNGYTPSLEEYLNNAWTSVGGPGAILHAYLLTQGCQLTEASLESFENCSQIVYWASIITRLSDDLATSKAENARGDVAKAVQCYMEEEEEEGISGEEAECYVKGLICYAWKKMNEESAKSSIPKSLVKLSLNMARTAHCIFQYGDGIGTSTGVTKDRLISLIACPIPIGKNHHDTQ